MNDQVYEGELIKIKIANLIKFSGSFAGVEVYIPIANKFVRLNYSTDQFVDILRRLQQREVIEVFVKPDDCSRILLKIQEDLSSHTFYDPKTIDEQKIEIANEAMAMVKSVINQIGVNVETVRLLKTVNVRAMAMLSESPTLYSFVKKFRKNCSDEFMRTTLTSYVMSLMIDQFDWKSDQVKEKGALASMLCDMVLEKEDFVEFRAGLTGGHDVAVSDRFRSHPQAVADKLRARRGLIPAETITIIEQHHELPNGKGFPSGITANRFNQLSSIFILSQQFIELLFQENFDYSKRMEIIARLKHTYDCKNFEKSLEALMAVVA